MRTGLKSQQWGRKKAAALAVAKVADGSPDVLAPHAPALLSALLAEVNRQISRNCLGCYPLAELVKVSVSCFPSPRWQ